MRYSKDMTEGKEYWSRNWNDTAANCYIKNGNTITVESVYRFGKSPAPVNYTIAQYDAWQDELRRSEASENTYGIA
jgi:hypothetical protein